MKTCYIGAIAEGRQVVTDKLKESVSALIDGEASEIEVHRLLRQLENDSSVKPSWINYLQVRSVMQGEHRLGTLQHVELHARICRAIENEETYALGPARRVPVWRTFAKPIAGLAVAASLAVAVTVGYYVQRPGAPEQVASTSPVAVAPQAIAAQPVSTGQTAGSQGQSPEFRQLDARQQNELREYLNMHDQMARMQPDAQMVIFENPTSDQ